MNTEQARELMGQFESCSLPREKWTHEAHFIMAFWYCSHLPLPLAIQSIREGIKKYNTSTGGANTDHAGYHETITIFYTRLIINYIFRSGEAAFDERLAYLLKQPFLQKDFPLQYYSREVLMSTQARRNWVPPDLRPLG